MYSGDGCVCGFVKNTCRRTARPGRAQEAVTNYCRKPATLKAAVSRQAIFTCWNTGVAYQRIVLFSGARLPAGYSSKEGAAVGDFHSCIERAASWSISLRVKNKHWCSPALITTHGGETSSLVLRVLLCSTLLKLASVHVPGCCCQHHSLMVVLHIDRTSVIGTGLFARTALGELRVR